jgi:hypothetical protein
MYLLLDQPICTIPYNVLTKIVNLSLDTGIMPSDVKVAMVKPILKKQTLSPEEFNSFRPISNLNFFSKVVEKVVANQLVEYLEHNDLHETFQTAYKKFHSVETALLRVHNDILEGIDK